MKKKQKQNKTICLKLGSIFKCERWYYFMWLMLSAILDVETRDRELGM